MNEIVRIHLAKTAYEIEVGAKKRLDKYLGDIAKVLGDDDTLTEVELRMVELLAERKVTAGGVIALADVEAIEKQLGEPAEFADGSAVDDQLTATTSDKRLMRDEQRGVLGGVMAGLGAYLGIEAIWLRLAAIVLTFVTSGFMVIIYIVLWIVVPAAKTAADRLQMTGQPVTLAAIKQKNSEILNDNQTRRAVLVLLRVVLGIGLAVAALSAMAATVVGGIGIGWRADHLYQATYLGGHHGLIYLFLALAVLCGLLLSLLLSMATYAALSWRLSRRMIISAVLVVLLGIASTGALAGLGVYVQHENQQNIASHTHQTSLPINGDLSKVTRLIVDRGSDYQIDYVVSSGTPRASLDSWDGSRSPELTIKGHQARVSFNDGLSAPYPGGYTPTLTIYGPALDELVDNGAGQVNYQAASQSKLAVTAGQGGYAALSGRIDKLSAKLKQNATLEADEATIGNVQAKLVSGSSLRLATVKQLALTANEACPNGERTSVQAEAVTSGRLTLNSKPVTAGSYQASCVDIQIRRDNDYR